MDSNPQIHFIEAKTYQEAEVLVNAWLLEQDFRCTILGVHPMPMMLEGKLVFLTTITYVGKPVNAVTNNHSGGYRHESLS